MTWMSKYFRLGGGLDLVTPAIDKDPGTIIAGVNHEPRPEGYRRIQGYERLDGRQEASAASYWVLNFDAGTVAVAEGDTVTGLNSDATGVALIAGVLSSGTYGAGTAAGYLVLTNVDGTFENDEPLQVSGSTVCVANGTTSERGASTDANDTTWFRDAVTTARAAIGTVPGSGPILGVYSWLGDRYAFRDTADATAAKMYRASLSGWAEMDLGRTVDFTSGGTTEIQELDTVTGASSGATAEVRRVIVTSGSWAGGDAAGRLILYNQSGTFQAENLNVGATLNVATIAGDSTAHSLPAGGAYEFRSHNFQGASGSKRMYGVNGVGTGFEWDGETFVPIITGMTQDTPTRIAVHRNHLFFGFPGGSVQHSGIGDPYAWSVVTGASEIALGDEITALLDGMTSTLGILCRNKTAILYGSSSVDWDLDVFTNEAGGVPWTAQNLIQPVYFDDQGIRSLSATQQYGDFKAATLSNIIHPLIEQKKNNGVLPTASIRVKAKNQYRIFFDDNTGLIMDLSGKRPGFFPVDYGMVIRCASAGEDPDGSEILLFGSDDGYVYRMDAGTSFDGAAVTAYFRLAFNHLGTPANIKRYFGAQIEATAPQGTAIQTTADFAYGDSDNPGATVESFSIDGGGGFWDESNWEDFYWDAAVVGAAQVRFDGRGANVSLAMRSSLIWAEPYTIHGVTLKYADRAAKRGGHAA